MQLKPVRRIHFDRCNMCGSEGQLVYGSILYGSICNDCINARFARTPQGKAYLIGLENYLQYEKYILNDCDSAPLIRAALMDIYGRYRAIISCIEVGDRSILILLKSKYRGRDSEIAIETPRTCETNKINLTYTIKDTKTSRINVRRHYCLIDNKVYEVINK